MTETETYYQVKQGLNYKGNAYECGTQKLEIGFVRINGRVEIVTVNVGK